MFEFKNLIKPSATVMMNSLAQKKKAAGERIFNLSAGEPVVVPQRVIGEAAWQAIQAGKTQYAPVMGIPELRVAATDWLNKIYSTDFTVENTLVTCGGKFGLYALARLLLSVGDEAIIIAPYWTSYRGLIEMTGAKPIVINTTETSGWKMTPELFTATITPNTKCIFFNNAANPTGVVYTRAEIQELIAIAAAHNILFISDEVYSGLVYEGEFVSAGSFLEYKDFVVIIQSASKHFAMTGWRVGFVFGPTVIIKNIADLQSQSTTGTSIISQYAAVSAFNHGELVMADVCAQMLERRNVLVGLLQKFFSSTISTPKSGLYVFVSLLELGVNNSDDVAFCEDLLQKGNIALVPGSSFGAPGYVRFSFGAPGEELTAAVEALAQYLKK